LKPQPLGEVIFVPAGHRYAGGGGAGIQRNLFLFLDASQGLDDEGDFERLAPIRPHDCMNLRCDRIRFLLTQISRELYEPGFASELMLEGLGTTLLAETLRLLHQKRQRELGRGGLSPTHMRLINELVRDSEVMPSLGDIANTCQLSRRHLMRAFRQETGQTVGEFVQRLAIEKAMTLLRETDQLVAAIAAAAGFASPSAFSTAFRRITGESPREYRARQRALMITMGSHPSN
ncbi:MAG: helix-turn-helix transcriptional regulator, partial [Bacteroidales bacterium]|nr:helix-turn-helix transcriptional regulator [Bacteroidales bacterium]